MSGTLFAALITLTAWLAMGVEAQSQSKPAPTSLTEKAAPARRSSSGRLLVMATPSREPVRIDGSLDDEAWRIARRVAGFVQSEPREGDPATEETEVRLAYDSDNLYIAAYCHDRKPEGIVVNEIRKDFLGRDQDTFEVILDTFGDRRNGFIFMTNPAGARSDQQVTNEGREVNMSWDAVWTVRTSKVSDGWIVEMALPFNSLRFDMNRSPIWGINFSRRIRRKNEVDYWAPIPRSYALSRVSLAGDLEGLPSARPGRDLRVKPYVAASTVRSAGGESFARDANVGLDVKYGITRSLTLDVTANPDFSQVEADELQVNLTQFSQFYPEKREFFLENSGIFYVGDGASRVSYLTPRPDTDLLVFFSRRIGLDSEGNPIPITLGGRVTGRVGGLSLGALTVQTERAGEIPASNYTVIRVRKDVFANSDIGAVFMTRQSTENSGDYNRVYGLDANIRFFGNVDWSTYVLKTATPGLTTGQYAFRSTLNREGNFFHVKGGIMSLGDHFNNELGYYRRIGVRKYLLDTGIRPRPKVLQRHGIREMHPHIIANIFTNHSGDLVARQLHIGYTFFFNSGGWCEFIVLPEYQLLTEPFFIHHGSPPIPEGGYSWVPYQIWISTDDSRMLSGSFRGTVGGLWSGTQRSIQAEVTLKPSHKFSFSLGVHRTDASLEQPLTDFVTSIWTMRANYSFTTNMFLDSLVQYNRDRSMVNANIRFNIIHHPLSDLFIVYNEQRFTTPENPIATGRGFIVKFTQMLSF
jgi:hypothetical protein